ncbi:MAG: BTAD domain-containing putative transcriptional regulator [Stenotrophomonas sp.]
MSAWVGNRPPLIRLLGECRIGDDARPQRLAYRKGWALLAYLAVERTRTHRRSQVAAMLWPELEQHAALTNLRQVLRDLNQALLATVGEGVLLVDRETVRLCPQASQGLLDIDLLESGSVGTDWLLEAGELLDGIVLDHCDDFGEWLLGVRSWTWRRLLGALERGRDDAAACGDMALAVRLARRQVALDRWDEEGQRGLMRLYQQMGKPGMALECYRLLEDYLRRELAVEPQVATRALAAEIEQYAPRPFMPPLRMPAWDARMSQLWAGMRV